MFFTFVLFCFKFYIACGSKNTQVIANIQYYYECSDGAKAEREKLRKNQQFYHAGPDDNDKTEFDMDIDDVREIGEIQEAILSNEHEITDDDIERARLMKTHARE